MLSGFQDNPKMDPLDGIAAFARVVDGGSFSAAAYRLGISKSAVSAHVQRLEERLGIRLLNRSTRRLSLTEAGAAYYRHCARILAEAESAEQVASALQREPRGTLRISAPNSFGWMHVGPAVPAFLKRYPELSVDITLSPAHVNLVDEGLDLAISIGVLEDSPLVVRRLAPSRLVVCATPAYHKEHGKPREPGVEPDRPAGRPDPRHRAARGRTDRPARWRSGPVEHGFPGSRPAHRPPRRGSRRLPGSRRLTTS